MRTTAVVILLLLAVWLVSACTYVVDETEYVVVNRLGNPVQVRMEPGLGVKWPWPVDALIRYDNRLMVLEVPRPGEPDREYLTLDVESGIGKNVEVTTYTCWRIKPDPQSVRVFLETVGDRAGAEALLADVVGSKLGIALGGHDFSALVSVDPAQRCWTSLLESVRQACRDDVGPAYGIDIVDVQIQRLNFPDQNRRNVFDRMRAERERIAARYRSEGEERATAVRAEADRQREQILATAYMESERVRGAADAEAARIYGEAYGQDPEFYEFLRTLQSYESTFDKDTVLILSSDSEFLRLLNMPVDESALSRPDRPSRSEHARRHPTTQPADRAE